MANVTDLQTKYSKLAQEYSKVNTPPHIVVEVKHVDCVECTVNETQKLPVVLLALATGTVITDKWCSNVFS